MDCNGSSLPGRSGRATSRVKICSLGYDAGMRKILGPAFFDRPTLLVAKDLLGKYLVRKIGNETIALMINETEAYDGHKDKASHAHRGQTVRNTPMFGGAGVIYVYFTYGIHWMLNLVCGKPGYPAAVLIRGAGHIVGPARLTKALSIDKTLSAQPLGKKAGLWVEDRGVVVKSRDIIRTPRIGINYAGEYVDKPWRFVLKESFQE
jgi:DNA-3-methyladenine glycosylase